MFKKPERIDEFVIFLNQIMQAWERYDKRHIGNLSTFTEEKYTDLKKKKGK